MASPDAADEAGIPAGSVNDDAADGAGIPAGFVNDDADPYVIALLDWLGCAVGGWGEPATRAARTVGDPVLALGAAGHVLDYDDTYLPGLAHLSAPTAPVAMTLAAERGADVGDALAAFAAGFEAMGAMSRASHPALYEGGWHPTAVCGPVGAAVTAARLLGLGPDGERTAVAIALLRAGGLRAAFGSDGKALQVGMAAVTGVTAARLAGSGAAVELEQAARGPAGFDAAFGARFAEPDGVRRAADENWIKAWPCCLQTHGAIEAAAQARAEGLEAGARVEVVVHPISLRAAAYGPAVADGLQAKFSIPYCTALTLSIGPPRPESFAAVDQTIVEAAKRVRVVADADLAESEAVLTADGREIRIEAAVGSPQRPLQDRAMKHKLADLGASHLVGILEDSGRSASSVLQAAGLD